MRHLSKNIVYPLLVAVLLAMASLACGESSSQKLSEAAAATTDAAKPTASAAAQKPTPEDQPTQPPEPTQSPEPTQPPPTPIPQAQALVLTSQGFGQDERDVGFAFLIENPNEGFAIENSQYQLAAYNDTGAVVETESGYIELILPKQTLGVGGTMWLDEGVTVSRIEVQLKEGDAVATDPIPFFLVDAASYHAGDISKSVSGVVNNPFNRAIDNLRISAIAYNETGDIIGGGFTFLDFILANSSTGVDVYVTSAGPVSRVELHPTLSGLSLLGSERELPEGANDLVLVKQGYGQSDRNVGFGLVVENPNDSYAVENSQYHITIFAEDGTVLGTEEGYIEVLLPNQIFGIGGTSLLPEGVTAARAEIQILAGTFEPSELIPSFTAENISYQADEYFPKVTGEIVSPYTQDISNIRVSALLYNEAGEIIGGGFTYADFVPANGKVAVEISVEGSQVPASVELYATISGLSEFE